MESRKACSCKVFFLGADKYWFITKPLWQLKVTLKPWYKTFFTKDGIDFLRPVGDVRNILPRFVVVWLQLAGSKTLSFYPLKHLLELFANSKMYFEMTLYFYFFVYRIWGGIFRFRFALRPSFSENMNLALNFRFKSLAVIFVCAYLFLHTLLYNNNPLFPVGM